MSGRPKPIANILSELMAHRGYARVQSGGRCAEAWQQAAGETVASYTRAGQVRRGVLEVIVGNSTLVQELPFQKSALLKKLAEMLPEENVRDLRFRVGMID